MEGESRTWPLRRIIHYLLSSPQVSLPSAPLLGAWAGMHLSSESPFYSPEELWLPLLASLGVFGAGHKPHVFSGALRGPLTRLLHG